MNLIFNTVYNFIFFTSSFEGFSLILLNIFIYIYLLFNVFGLFFLFDLRYLRTLNELKNCGNLMFITISLTLLLISLAGVPPLLGFVGKFLLFIFLIKSSNWFLVIFFSLINFFVIYFYIQNLRFLVTKNIFFFFNFNQYHVFLNFHLVFFLVLLNTLNFFGILFIDDVILAFISTANLLVFN